jgi:hypothetical protein
MASPKPKVGDTVRRIGPHTAHGRNWANRECSIGSVGVVTSTSGGNASVTWRSHGPDCTRSPGNNSAIDFDALEVIDPGRRRVEVGDLVEYTETQTPRYRGKRGRVLSYYDNGTNVDVRFEGDATASGPIKVSNLTVIEPNAYTPGARFTLAPGAQTGFHHTVSVVEINRNHPGMIMGAYECNRVDGSQGPDCALVKPANLVAWVPAGTPVGPLDFTVNFSNTPTTPEENPEMTTLTFKTSALVDALTATRDAHAAVYDNAVRIWNEQVVSTPETVRAAYYTAMAEGLASGVLVVRHDDVILKDRDGDRALLPTEAPSWTAEQITDGVARVEARKARALRPFGVALDTLGRLATETVDLPDNHAWLALKDSPAPTITA